MAKSVAVYLRRFAHVLLRGTVFQGIFASASLRLFRQRHKRKISHQAGRRKNGIRLLLSCDRLGNDVDCVQRVSRNILGYACNGNLRRHDYRLFQQNTGQNNNRKTALPQTRKVFRDKRRRFVGENRRIRARIKISARLNQFQTSLSKHFAALTA